MPVACIALMRRSPVRFAVEQGRTLGVRALHWRELISSMTGKHSRRRHEAAWQKRWRSFFHTHAARVLPKRGVGDRHGRSLWGRPRFPLRPRSCCASAFDRYSCRGRFCLSKDAVRPGQSRCRRPKASIQPCGIIPDGYLAITLVVGEIHASGAFGEQVPDDQLEALRPTGCRISSIAGYLQRDWPNVADHRSCETLTQL